MNEIRSLSKGVWGENISASNLEARFEKVLPTLFSRVLNKDISSLVGHLNKIVTKISVRFGQTPDWPVMSKMAHKVVCTAISLRPASYDWFTQLPGDVKRKILSYLNFKCRDRLVSKDFKHCWDAEWNEHHKLYWVTPPSVTENSFHKVAQFYSQCSHVNFSKIEDRYFFSFLPYFSNARTIDLGRRLHVPLMIPLEGCCPKLEEFKMHIFLDYNSTHISFPKTIQKIWVSCGNKNDSHSGLYCRPNVNILFPDSLNFLTSLHIDLSDSINLHKTNFPQLRKIYLRRVRCEPPLAPLLEKLTYIQGYMDGELDLTRYPLLRKVFLKKQDIKTLQVPASVEHLTIKLCGRLSQIVFHGNSLKTLKLKFTKPDQLDLSGQTQLESLVATGNIQLHLHHIPQVLIVGSNVRIDYGPHKRARNN